MVRESRGVLFNEHHKPASLLELDFSLAKIFAGEIELQVRKKHDNRKKANGRKKCCQSFATALMAQEFMTCNNGGR